MGRKGHAWTIASPLLSRDVNEIALEYPVTTEIKLTDPRYNEVLSEFYENCCNRLKEYLGNGEDVVVLCEGDPFFYGSFMHLHSRLANFAQYKWFRLQPVCQELGLQLGSLLRGAMTF